MKKKKPNVLVYLYRTGFTSFSTDELVLTGMEIWPAKWGEIERESDRRNEGKSRKSVWGFLRGTVGCYRL